MTPVGALMGGLLLLLLVGVPAAYSMGLASVVYFAIQRGVLAVPLELIASRVVYGIDSFPLLAVPLFLLVGHLMNESGATTRIFHFSNAVVGHVRGGLGHVNVLGSMIFAGMSGSGTADAAGLGAIEIRAMREAGYDDHFTLGVTAGSALIGPIIPPSIPAILYAILADVSAGRLLLAGAVPGALMGAAMMGLVVLYAWRNGYPRAPFAGFAAIWQTFLGAAWSLLTPVILIGGIVSGLFTATEAGAIAAVWATLLACLVYRSVGLAGLRDIVRRATLDSAIVMFILACSSLFAWILTRARVPGAIAAWIGGLDLPPPVVLAVIVAFLLAVGCFTAVSVAINVLTPILAPAAVAIGMDPVHFGVVMIMTLVIGEVTPPFGMVLFVITRVSGRPFAFVARACLPWILAVLAVVILVAAVPPLALWLPDLVMR